MKTTIPAHVSKRKENKNDAKNAIKMEAKISHLAFPIPSKIDSKLIPLKVSLSLRTNSALSGRQNLSNIAKVS